MYVHTVIEIDGERYEVTFDGDPLVLENLMDAWEVREQAKSAGDSYGAGEVAAMQRADQRGGGRGERGDPGVGTGAFVSGGEGGG